MSRSRRYLNNLPNVERVKQLSREILDSELKLDRAISNKEEINKDISSLERELTSLDKSKDPQKIKTIKEKLEELSYDSKKNDVEIANLKNHVFRSQNIFDEEIREGLFQLFYQAKSGFEEAQQNIRKNQKLVEEAQNKLLNSHRDESEKYRDEWVRNVEKIIQDEEKLKKCEEQLDAVKRVYKLEFG
ncbi:hypothetical protein [Methanobacterium ferruginis]|uniref:hypothetical protein n=1 Tax=Methanobacterium ferruginis TaxID=710191 RepID=UPI0025731084|nr:hypothetical protein [Methanobacterium ferruginis]MCC7550487.1 hypothetical protein [Methanobacterium sp.]BDZ67298.1 hypothetical protein GCM10025860_07460 [Methanobacterium ferruginis]